MSALAWLIPCALALGLLGLVAFLWALNSGQFEDLDGAGWRAIQDDPEEPAPTRAAASRAEESDRPDPAPR
ncbi:cbb3-type cytochrome oxidase assembly protein CcoS [Hyphomicrobium sp.]|uniref:cbb3-type cytochrome oxidase assembly protein CcoS n=1 Tax=Hyphomicrobium sp. TaxID=82 RepID=UPI0025BE9013|nr:cbb3-type cytochrome oxidase assembly protein CcoS [Hyphomicrobium sp.]MCC7253853.1 cbb3-type cytochrome oxidase assembly protein CcoS [Hyphomicrobium sp.]